MFEGSSVQHMIMINTSWSFQAGQLENLETYQLEKPLNSFGQHVFIDCKTWEATKQINLCTTWRILLNAKIHIKYNMKLHESNRKT